MIDPNKVYHVYPVDDLEEHYLECVYPAIGHPYCPCKCKPKFIEEGDALIIRHNSFDGREGLEWVKEILK
jgi:hypothetical protein